METAIFIVVAIVIVAFVVVQVLKKKKNIVITPVGQPATPVPSIITPVKWYDKRAIGMIMVANYVKFTGKKNYVTDDFQAFAKQCIAYLTYINAQGFIIWDSEGAMYPRPYTYYGDPRLTPPELDVLFITLRDAGFTPGVCLRPTVIKIGDKPQHFTTNVLDDLTNKADYTYKRWGCRLFYVDSNVGDEYPIGTNNTNGYGNLMNVAPFKALHERFPDCLFIPEHHDESYIPYTALYWDRKWTNNLYGRAVINCSDTWWPQEWIDEAVKNGHILMGRVWYASPEIDKIKQAYEQT